MYLKLRTPGNSRKDCVLIPIPTGEVAYRLLLDMDDDAIDRQLSVYQRNGWDRRRFMFWEAGDMAVPQRTIEIEIPSAHSEVIITNHDAFLLNEHGQIFERIFRYLPSALAVVPPGSVVIERGVPGEELPLED